MTLRISIFPSGGMEIASARIRAYSLVEPLRARGTKVSFGMNLFADIFYFQKRVNAGILRYARMARLLGGRIVYDVDDLGEALNHWTTERDFNSMLHLADLVTTCSQQQSEILQRRYPAIRFEVIPNLVDYFLDAPVRNLRLEKNTLRTVWFGNFTNFWMFERHLPTLLSLPALEVNVITNVGALRDKVAAYPPVRFHDWSLDSFVANLRSCDVAILSHHGTQEDYSKGNNKMITAICCGLPVIASRTPEYERTATEAHVSEFLFRDDRELVGVVTKLRDPDRRTQYLDNAQQVIWQQYSPPRVADRFLDLARSQLKQRW